VARLEAEGVFSRNGAGYRQDECRLRYIAHLRAERTRSPRTEAETEYQQQKAHWLSLRIAKHQREHLTMEEHCRVIDTLAGIPLTGLASLPAAMSGNDLTIRRKWERFVYDLRTKLANEALRLADEAEKNGTRC